MKSYVKKQMSWHVCMLVLGLLTCVSGFAMRGGGGEGRGGDFNRGGDYYRGNDDYRGGYRDGVYYDNRVADPAVVVAVPEGEVSESCSSVQQCDNDGNCVQSQVCN